ncbi:MAG: Gfo/Idh/MocA family oxidoreductase [Actinomycetales bacterium]|nr:Gfo/Idh/MocA family oxidoreductase [Actinomycetales bacterium]
MTSPHLRWGVLAPGGIARSQVADLQRVGIPVVAAGSRDLERARSFAADFDIPRAYGSYDELLADDEVDVVYVATTHNAHADAALLALRAGKHVLVEKPFTVTGAQARAIAEAAEAADRVVLEAMWTRYLPSMVRLRDILAAGTIGEVRAVVADHSQLLTHVDRLMNPATAGGALLDLGIYPVAFAWDVLGAPERFLAAATMTATGVDETTSMILEYASGAQAVLTATLASPGATRAFVHGTAGRIEFDGPFYGWVGFTVFDAAGELVERYEPEREGRGMQFQALELERIVASGERTGTIQPIGQTVAIMEFLDAVRERIGLRFPEE